MGADAESLAQWMPQLTVDGDNMCPIWAVAGGPQDALWMQYLPSPYVIPAHQAPTFNFQNGAAVADESGQIYMLGMQLLD